jgi:hypothetical protein
MDFSMSEVCGWRWNLESDKAGEFWVDREALTQKMSQMSETQRAMYRWGIVFEFNEGLDRILGEDQAVGEMRDDFREQ